MSPTIDTESASVKYRAKMIDLGRRRLLVTNFLGSEQANDLTVPPNCSGFGRVRHFRRERVEGWPPNPLPIDPACRALGLPSTSQLRAQVFQTAGCNWRCWYCYVPYNLLAADPRHAAWLTPAELVDLYVADPDPPPMIDLTGGQPDLVPEWAIWMMEELRSRGLEKSVYLWTDDSLSSDYLWRYLSDSQLALLGSYSQFGRVCCFKGFDESSFAFNTAAAGHLFARQFELFRRHLDLGADLYAYVTLTGPPTSDLPAAIARFVDQLQEIHPNLPLRTIPLPIEVFGPVKSRLNTERSASLTLQFRAVDLFLRELQARFPSSALTIPIVEVPLRRGEI